MLEAVQEGQDYGIVEDAVGEAVEGRLEGVGLHRDDEERHRSFESNHCLRMCDGRVVAGREGQAFRADRGDGALGADAERSRPDGDHPADASEAEDGDPVPARHDSRRSVARARLRPGSSRPGFSQNPAIRTPWCSLGLKRHTPLTSARGRRRG